ncbi:MAG: glutamate racemase [Candidatus Omnitrophota bacterium]
MNNRPIGVFDSGLGGLTVVKELINELPYEDIVYFGDTARLPYGSKSKETIIRFTLDNILFLLNQNVKLIVIACNTSSSIALPKIKGYFGIPLIGVIEPGAKEAVRVTRNNRIGIIGTEATVKSKSYQEKISELSKNAKVFVKACPLFVPLVENGHTKSQFTVDIAKSYLDEFKRNNVDTVVLGCTHYPLLKMPISQVLGKSIVLVDSAKVVASEVKNLLYHMNIKNTSKVSSRQKFYVSDEPEGFKIKARQFLGCNMGEVQKISI